MMGRQSGQMSMVILDIAELIPTDHLLRKIDQMVSFDFIYDLVAPYYQRAPNHVFFVFAKLILPDHTAGGVDDADEPAHSAEQPRSF